MVESVAKMTEDTPYQPQAEATPMDTQVITKDKPKQYIGTP